MTNAPAQPEQGVEAARQLLESYLIPPGLYEHATVFARGANALAVKALALLPREAPAAVAWQVRPLGDKVWHITDDPRPAMGYEKRPLFASPAPAPEAPAGLPDDVVRLVIVARTFAYSDPFPEDKTELDEALGAFDKRVGWDDEPNEEAALATQADAPKGDA